MVNNLDGKLENSKIPAVVASDVNDDEVEIDLREILQALKRKILLILMVALIGGCARQTHEWLATANSIFFYFLNF